MMKERTFIISGLTAALAVCEVACGRVQVQAQNYSSTKPVAASLAAVTTPVPTTVPIVVATPVPTPVPTPTPVATPVPTPVATVVPVAATPTPTPTPLPVTAGGADTSAFLLMAGIATCIFAVYQLKLKSIVK